MFQKLNLDKIFIGYIFLAGILANIYFYFTLSSRAVGFGDSWSRMNIGRRVVDSLTPGIAQLGGIWLPFPQLLIVPFVWLDPLYYSGVAGAFISTPAFILGGIYLYKSLKKMVLNRFIPFIGSVLYASNINLLYIQTTPMSESLFLCCVFGALYHFIKWQEDVKKNLISLILAGFWTFVATLTRYEGYLLLLIMTFSVIVIAYTKTKNRKIVEGVFFIFVTLAAFGVLLWQMYSWVIFGDPLNWYKIYTGQRAVVSTVSVKPQETWGIEDYRGDIKKSVVSVVESSLEMNGVLFIIPVVLGVFIFLYFAAVAVHKRKLTITLVVILIASAPGLFLMLSSFRGTALVRGPSVNSLMFTNFLYYLGDEYNLRYGLLTLPFLVVFTSLIFSLNTVTRILFIVFALTQIGVMYWGKPNTVYSFPAHYLNVASYNDQTFVNRFHEIYDGGLILTSAIANDQVLYSLKIPYKNYIYEGTNKYWRESVINPTKHATWILMKNGPKVTNTGGSSDFVSYYLQDTVILADNYDLVYRDEKMLLYKIKGKLKS